MTACEQTGDGQFYRLILAYDNFTNLLREGVNGVGHPKIICGNAALRKCGVLTGFRLGWSRGGMGVAITFCDQTEHERREDKCDHSFFHRSKSESLPRLIQFEAPAFCNH